MTISNEKAKMAIGQRIKFGLARGTNKVLRKDKDSAVDSIQQLARDEKYFSDEKKHLKTLSFNFEHFCQKLSASKKAAAELEASISNTTILDEDTKSDVCDETVDVMRKSGNCCLSDAKRLVHEALDKIKKVRNAHQDFLTAKRSYEKCKEDKMVKAKRMVDDLEVKYESSLQRINDEIPQVRDNVKNYLEDFAKDYIKWKKDYLEKEIKATNEFGSRQNITLSTSLESSEYANASSLNYASADGGFNSQVPASAFLANLAKSNSFSESSTPTRDSSSSSDGGSHKASEVNGKIEHEMNITTDLSLLTPPFKVISLYQYAPDEPDELSFNVNDELQVLKWSNDEQEPGWLNGKNLRTGATGIFPINYVKKI